MSSLKIIKGIENLKVEIDVLIDFSLPASTKLTIEFSLSHRIPLVVGTTGIESLESQTADSFRDTNFRFSKYECWS